MSLIEPAGRMSPVFAGIIAYAFPGLAEVTEELVDPFGPTRNSLPPDAICRNAEISMAPHPDPPVPPRLQPQDYFLG